MATGTPATALLARAKIAFTLYPYQHDPRADEDHYAEDLMMDVIAGDSDVAQSQATAAA